MNGQLLITPTPGCLSLRSKVFRDVDDGASPIYEALDLCTLDCFRKVIEIARTVIGNGVVGLPASICQPTRTRRCQKIAHTFTNIRVRRDVGGRWHIDSFLPVFPCSG